MKCFQACQECPLRNRETSDENDCEGNEDPDLWMAFLHAERTLRQAGES